jgi:hypothetical protein
MRPAGRCVFGEFVYDPGARSLTRNGEAVPLAPRAFDLLGALLAARPRALDKAELITQLWPGTWVSRTSLAQLVTQLRKATGDDTRRPRLIRTVFGHGYAWICEALDLDGEPASGSRPEARCWMRHGGVDVVLRPGHNVVGRSSDAVVRLRSDQASRRQAVVVVDGGTVTIEDLDSRNGTFLNGRRLGGKATLRDGDHIAVGDEVMVFCAAAEGTTRDAAGARA